MVNVLFEDLSEDCSLGGNLSDSGEELLSRSKQGGRVASFCWKSKRNVVEHQKITTNLKKTQTSQVNDFSAFLCMGRCRSLNLVKFSF